jgi:hypothetical protein
MNKATTIAIPHPFGKRGFAKGCGFVKNLLKRLAGFNPVAVMSMFGLHSTIRPPFWFVVGKISREPSQGESDNINDNKYFKYYQSTLRKQGWNRNDWFSIIPKFHYDLKIWQANIGHWASSHNLACPGGWIR